MPFEVFLGLPVNIRCEAVIIKKVRFVRDTDVLLNAQCHLRENTIQQLQIAQFILFLKHVKQF